MAFFDKLNKLVKDTGDKANELLEIGKLNGKISTERSAISTIKEQMGEYVWAKYQEGAAFDEQLSEYCASIQASLEAIAELQAQIDELKAPTEEPAPVVPTCPACGVEVSEEAKFCPACGAKLEVPAPAQEEAPAEETAEEEAPAEIKCPECEAMNPAGTNFCSGCGTKLN